MQRKFEGKRLYLWRFSGLKMEGERCDEKEALLGGLGQRKMMATLWLLVFLYFLLIISFDDDESENLLTSESFPFSLLNIVDDDTFF